MSCRWRENVAAYVDDELEPAAQEAFSAHLGGCAECPALVREGMELKRVVRLAGRGFPAPPALHAAVYRAIHPHQTTSWWWKWGLAPLILFLLGIIGFLLYPKTASDPMIARVVDLHVTNLASANPVDVLSSDRHTVKPWYAGKLPFTFNLPELAGSSFVLIGGKVAYAGQQPGAQLWYQAGPHKISVFVFQARVPRDKPEFNHDLSFNVNRWSEGGLVYYVVTDGSPSEAGKLVQMFQEANHG